MTERGTSVRLKLQNALSPLLDRGFLEGSLRRHYQPLLDPAFGPFLSPHYPHAVCFEVNSRLLEKEGWPAPETAPFEVRLLRKRKPSAVGYLVRHTQPLPESQRGIGISTFGKIIKRGWDWLGVLPQTPERIGGLIEVPALASCLTLNKGDFIRVGPRGALYLAYRKAIQEAVSRQLSIWGDIREPTEEARRRVMRPLERDLAQVVEVLSHDFPLLASLVEQRAGGQKRLPIGTREAPAGRPALVAAAINPPLQQAEDRTGTEVPPAKSEAGSEAGESEHPSGTRIPPEGGSAPGTGGARVPAHYGLGIQFEDRPGDPELGRLVESTVWVNTAHPAYRRAVASRAEGYHLALSVLLALSPLATDPKDEHTFVNTFLALWGKAFERSGGRKRQ